jgi:hypothetical protein
MRATGIIADLPVADVEAAKSFSTDYLDLSTEEFNMLGGPLHIPGHRRERPARDARRRGAETLPSPCSRRTLTAHMPKRRNAATRSCTR